MKTKTPSKLIWKLIVMFIMLLCQNGIADTPLFSDDFSKGLGKWIVKIPSGNKVEAVVGSDGRGALNVENTVWQPLSISGLECSDFIIETVIRPTTEGGSVGLWITFRSTTKQDGYSLQLNGKGQLLFVSLVKHGAPAQFLIQNKRMQKISADKEFNLRLQAAGSDIKAVFTQNNQSEEVIYMDSDFVKGKVSLTIPPQKKISLLGFTIYSSSGTLSAPATPSTANISAQLPKPATASPTQVTGASAVPASSRTPVATGKTKAGQKLRVLIIGDQVIAGCLEGVQKILSADADVVFLLTSDKDPLNIESLTGRLTALGGNWDLIHYSFGREALLQGNKVLDCQNAHQKITEFISTKAGARKAVFATALPLLPDSDSRGQLINQYNQGVVQRTMMKNVQVSDLHEYVRLRKGDMLDAATTGLSSVGIKLLSDVIATTILDLASEGSDRALPFVAVLGDSIVSQYNIPLRNALRGVANIVNGGTAYADTIDWERVVADNITSKEQTGNFRFSLIQFNWGLHAAKYINEKGGTATVTTGRQCVPLERYREELEKFVLALRKKNVRLVWASTTPVQRGNAMYVDGDIPRYNQVAAEVMKKYDIPINDLYSVVMSDLKANDLSGDLHYSLSGAEKLATATSVFLKNYIPSTGGTMKSSASGSTTIEAGSFEAKAGEYNWTTTPVAGLPNLMIFGDSISIGYTPFVKEKLQGKVNVYRPIDVKINRPENCSDSGKGAISLDRWLGDTKWDIIHFNFGLHDIKRVTPEKGVSSDDPTVAPWTSLENYRTNLEKIVERLKKTGAILVFATTTPFPEGTIPSRIPSDAVAYNKVAMEVMEKYNVQVNDFYEIMLPRLTELQHPKNVHFNNEGQKYMGQVVADLVLKLLSAGEAGKSESGQVKDSKDSKKSRRGKK